MEPPAAQNPPSSLAPATTYVQADAHTFRDLVQRLTGADPSARSPSAALGPRRPAFKLQDRRGTVVSNLEIQLGRASLRSSPRSTLALPMIPSPVTPSPSEEEDRAIAAKGFYLHPSPRGSEPPPELLPLFPLSSPRRPKHGEEEQENLELSRGMM